MRIELVILFVLSNLDLPCHPVRIGKNMNDKTQCMPSLDILKGKHNKCMVCQIYAFLAIGLKLIMMLRMLVVKLGHI